MIFDAFQFHNEIDILDIRLHELSDVVDWFVLVEATKTHSGKDKPLYYKENRDRFAKFSSRILNICVQDMPMTKAELNATLTQQDYLWIESDYQREDNWVRERFQRNAMMRILKEAADPDDVIIIGDADEIVKATVLENLDLCEGSNAVEQTLNTYYANWQCTNAVREKIKSYAHQEFNVPGVLDRVEGRLANKKDALGRLYEYKVVPIDYEHFPSYLVDNQDKFSHLIYRE